MGLLNAATMAFVEVLAVAKVFKHMNSLGLIVLRQSNSSTSDPMDNCKYAFLVDKDWFLFEVPNFWDVKHMDNVPVVLDWILNAHDYGERFREKPDLTGNYSTPICRRNNVTLTSRHNRTSMNCRCKLGMEGNPYLLQPCQDIDECKGSNECGDDVCEKVAGGYSCCSNINGRIRICLGSGVGLLFLLIGAWWVHKIVKKRKTIARKKMFFKRNGGLLLEQQLLSGEVNVDKIKLFNSKELEKATNNFSIDRILGQGGQGTVYKGMLADGRIVAIKKSKMVDKSRLSEFINEVVILSQINHRNVVQIIGCCLETEVPLLVYEFIPNGTLSQYIQEQIEEFPLTWDMGYKLPQKLQELFRTYTVQLPFPYIIETSSLPTYFWMKNTEQKLLILELQDQFPLTKLI
ncbi:hypothetical protein L3X38_027265 [Prunus dulcis]|uniref:Protein kinase domain-containing protein n=1 Tax=Prunus dulcis TaxID=3755 RepID=A0AAD4VMM0_PRUDU|nr:hypothetical protein L3X38_027265 [Prunus dulcis]